MSWCPAVLGAMVALLAACSGASTAGRGPAGAPDAGPPPGASGAPEAAPDRADVCGADEVVDEVEPAMPRVSGQGQMVSQVLVVGTHRMPSDWVAQQLSVRPGVRLGATSLDDDVKRLLTMDAFERVEARIARDPVGLAVTFVLSERPRIAHVLMEPSDADPTGLDVMLPRPGELLDGSLARSLRRIELRWRASGHLDARARAWVRRRGERADVCVSLTKGAQWQVERIDFPGVTAFPVDELRELVAGPRSQWNAPGEPFREDRLETPLLRIQAAYYDLGRLQAEIGPPAIERLPDGRRLVVSLPAREGPEFHLGQIAIEGAPPAERRRYLELLGAATGDLFARSRLFDGVGRIRSAARERLGPKADVEVKTRYQPSERVDLTLHIQEPQE